MTGLFCIVKKMRSHIIVQFDETWQWLLSIVDRAKHVGESDDCHFRHILVKVLFSVSNVEYLSTQVYVDLCAMAYFVTCDLVLSKQCRHVNSKFHSLSTNNFLQLFVVEMKKGDLVCCAYFICSVMVDRNHCTLF